MHPCADEAAALWYVVYCLPRREAQVAETLATALDLPVYLPRITQRVRGAVQEVHFFPRYLFVAADLTRVSLSRLNTTPGLVRVVAFGERPQSLPAAAIATIRAQVDRLNNAGGLPAHPYQPGDHVRLTAGPLRDLEALFLGPSRAADRVRVLLQFLGAPHEVDVAVDWLDMAGARTAGHPARRTRGRGRPIRPPSPADVSGVTARTAR